MKRHSKEYLLDLSKKAEKWLQVLIEKTIESNGNVAETEKESIYQLLKCNESSKTNNDEENALLAQEDASVCLDYLKHIHGVNALKEGQTIIFNNAITILYGLNGSGKSSYFKVLNEICGGNQQKEILPNIYDDINKPIKVEIGYTYKGTSEKIEWSNKTRSLFPLNNVSVFDSSYLTGLLGKRTIGETKLTPFGLHLFQSLIKSMDEFKDRLSRDADLLRNTKPLIDANDCSENLKKSFELHALKPDQIKYIESCFQIKKEEIEAVEKKQEEIKSISQLNFNDKIQLESNRKNSLQEIIANVNSVCKSISEIRAQFDIYIEKYYTALELSNKAKEQLSVLDDIPSTDSDEWKQFIIAGQNYSKIAKNQDAICLYCRQPLRDKSIETVRAYSTYLNNKYELELQSITNSIQQQLELIDKLSVTIDCNKLPSLIKSVDVEGLEKLVQAVICFVDVIKLGRDDLRNAVNGKARRNYNVEIDCSKITSPLEAEIVEIDSLIFKMNASESERILNINSIKDSIKPLLERIAINNQKNEIKKWLEINKSELVLRNKASKISTRSMSDLAKVAANELITENLKQRFVCELNHLGLHKLNVTIESAGTSKGVNFTKLVITKANEITSILSEGEQKAVGLALFLAEIGIQQISYPIIFDDPVNSFDHKIADKFAERLMDLNSQIVVFTHNKLFLDSIETSSKAHICKTIKSACSKSKGRHVFLYLIQSESQSVKGLIIPGFENSAHNHIEYVEQKIQYDYSSIEISSRIRKAVECLIDEKVFNGLVPTKYSSKNNRIHWDNLKNMKVDSEFIDVLKDIHDRVSGGQIHNGTESEENPIDKDEFIDIISRLKSLVN